MNDSPHGTIAFATRHFIHSSLGLTAPPSGGLSTVKVQALDCKRRLVLPGAEPNMRYA